MQDVLTTTSFAPPIDRSMFTHLFEGEYRRPALTQDAYSDSEFVAMLHSYRDSGGLARVKEVVQLFKHRCGCELSLLAGWIAGRKVICFEWQSEMWLPLFQFNPFDMTLKPRFSLILAELGSDCDAWEVAHWFAQPSPWLGNCSPAAMLDLDYASVLNASRAARCVRQRTEQGAAFS